MNRHRAPVLLGFVFVFALASAGCAGVNELLHGPAPTDPLDGYRGNLAEAGISTEIDLGPKQSTLLAEYKALTEVKVELQRRLDELVAENQNLKAQIRGESTHLQQEQAARAQAEAETELLRQRCRDREAQILSLSIEKAKLEQSQLLNRIEALQHSLTQEPPNPVEAAGSPPGGR